MLVARFAVVCTLAQAMDGHCAGTQQCTPAADAENAFLQRDASSEKTLSIVAEASDTTKAGYTESQDLSARLLVMAKHAGSNDTARFLSSLRICTSCGRYLRFGEKNDGGYLTCMDGLEDAGGSSKLSSAFSLGVERYDQWSADVSEKLAIPVKQFDCTVSSAEPCPTCTFFSKCLKSDSGKGAPPGLEDQSWTFQEMLDNTGQASGADHSVLLKIDVEGAEWAFFAEEQESVLSKFQQIIVEFHRLGDEAQHPLYLQAMQKIARAGLLVAHLHGNNADVMYNVGDAAVPDTLEVTFIRGSRSQCLADQQSLPLDSPNRPDYADLPLAHLPA